MGQQPGQLQAHQPLLPHSPSPCWQPWAWDQRASKYQQGGQALISKLAWDMQAILSHTTQPHHASDDTKVANVASTFEFNHTAAQTMPVMMETCPCCSPVDQCSNHACHTTDNHSLPVMIKKSVPRWLCFLTCSTLVQWCLVGLSTLGPVLGGGAGTHGLAWLVACSHERGWACVQGPGVCGGVEGSSDRWGGAGSSRWATLLVWHVVL